MSFSRLVVLNVTNGGIIIVERIINININE